MGSFYTNIMLKGPGQQGVVEYFNEAGRRAYVSPTVNGLTVVYDEECDEQDVRLLAALASDLSAHFGCPALAALNHDDDALWYQLYDDGECQDEYHCFPDYLDPTAGGEPTGGDAGLLCAAFGVEGAAAQVEGVLREPLYEGRYTFAMDRHADLAEALGIPGSFVTTGYAYVEQGEVPDGVDPAKIVKTGPT
jgi:hypothetical protein